MATKNKMNEMQVGLLTVVALIILIAGLLWFKNVDLSKGSLSYQVDFDYVEGIARYSRQLVETHFVGKRRRRS